ncbi:MAG: efflux RND transporter periplasmic adaptor subunit [Clostridiales bacterium]|jgi:multidrug efflux pump subunit AcrA (membrane-fusion protein)|nr:efflux RND transporter periplasmic adaptor subunit [Clostridiales bacterium]
MERSEQWQDEETKRGDGTNDGVNGGVDSGMGGDADDVSADDNADGVGADDGAVNVREYDFDGVNGGFVINAQRTAEDVSAVSSESAPGPDSAVSVGSAPDPGSGIAAVGASDNIGLAARRPRRASRGGRAAGRLIVRLIRRLVLFALILAVATGVYYYYRIYLPIQQAQKEYLFANVVRKDVHTAVSATGNIAAKEEVSLYLAASQKVQTIHVKEGDRVSAGQTLISYDIATEQKNLEQKLAIAEINLKNSELNARSIALPATGNELLQYSADVTSAQKSLTDCENEIESIKIRINQQQIRVDDAQRTMEKNESLYALDFLTRDEYDQSVSAYRSATESQNALALSLSGQEQTLEHRRALLADAESKLMNAMNRLSDEANVIRYRQQENIVELAQIEIDQIKDDLADLTPTTVSPVDGNVVAVYVTEGGTASQSSAVIRLSDLSSVVVRSDVSEYDAPLLEVGQKVDIYSSGLPDTALNGVITRIASASVEKESGTEKEVVVPVEIAVDSADNRLKTGYTVDLDVIITEVKDVLSVPSQAIFNEGGERFAYVLLEIGEPIPEGLTVSDDATAQSETESAVSEPTTISVLGLSFALPSLDDVLAKIDSMLAAFGGQFTQNTADDAPVPVKISVTTGLYGDNGVEILAGLPEGTEVVLNP